MIKINKDTGYMESTCDYLQELPQYHFDRDEMCKVFDSDFIDWLWDHINEDSYDFGIKQRGDEFYIIHYPSGTIVNWYKHMGRTNTCNKPLTIEDLKDFKTLLLADFEWKDVIKCR